jgi:hypothetical protein
MRIEKSVEANGRRLQVVARMQTRKYGERICRVRVSEGHYFRDVTIADCSSTDEAVDRAVAMYLGTEGSTVMSKQKKTAKATGEAKKKGAQGARGAKKTVKASQNTQAAPERTTTQEVAPRGEETQAARKPGLLDAAILVLRETGQPMNTKEMVDAVLAKGIWSSSGKTPAATLYSSILREIQKKGEDARFVKSERGKFALKS